MDYVSTSLGTKISAPLFLGLGYYGVFGASAASCLLALAVLGCCVTESLDTAVTSVTSVTVTSPETPLAASAGQQLQYGTEQSGGVTASAAAAKTNILTTSLRFTVSRWVSRVTCRNVTRVTCPACGRWRRRGPGPAAGSWWPAS